MERLDKIISNLGYGSRKEVKSLVKKGFVEVDGEIVKDSNMKIDPDTSIIKVNGEELYYREYIYLMMNKPDGVISATYDNRDMTVIDLLHVDYQAFEPFPVGRLDKDTEGLLLFTNDGEFEHKIMYPDKHVKKTYFFIALGNLLDNEKEKLEEGVYINNGEYLTKSSKLEDIYNFTYLDAEEDFKDKYLNHLEYKFFNQKLVKGRITISEGKKHQVKKMLKSVGCKVIYLKRISIGSLKLDDSLELGEYRNLTEEEKNSIFK